MDLRRTALEQMWGFSVEAELIENSDRQDELCCYVSRVEDKSVAMQNGEFFSSLLLNFRWFRSEEMKYVNMLFIGSNSFIFFRNI